LCCQLLAGASPDEAQRWLLAQPSSYTYLNQSGVYELPGVDSAAEFGHTRHAMSLIGISSQQQEDVFRILSALLHLGNVVWEDAHHNSNCQHSSSKPDGLCNGTAEAAAAAAGAGGCPLAPGSESPAALAAAARLMGVEVAGLARALGTRTRMTPDGPITSPLDARAASSNRDALVKVIYARLFDWLVGRINSSIGQDPAAAANIGLLDIYGFESFQFNDLEQFCINLTNEKLQQHFNQHVFKWEQVRLVVQPGVCRVRGVVCYVGARADMSNRKDGDKVNSMYSQQGRLGCECANNPQWVWLLLPSTCILIVMPAGRAGKMRLAAMRCCAIGANLLLLLVLLLAMLVCRLSTRLKA
jgi:hypothetical protein